MMQTEALIEEHDADIRSECINIDLGLGVKMSCRETDVSVKLVNICIENKLPDSKDYFFRSKIDHSTEEKYN